MQRYTALDAFRGVAALGVAVYHWAFFTGAAMWPPIGNFYLFIDFFFVLSGFIIAAVYRDKVRDGASTARFLCLRLARLYPVHVLMLAAFLAVATLGEIIGGAPPLRDGMSADGFFGHLVLIQPLGQAASWNQPAWTISVEMQLCVLFALLCLAGVLQSALGRLCLGAAVAATLFYLTTQHGDLNITAANAFGRGFVSFATGVLLHSIATHQWVSGALTSAKRRAGSGLEAAAITIVCAYVTLSDGAAAFAAPFLFAAMIFIFLDDQGVISRALRWPFFQRLGALGYAIYMAHFLFIPPMQNMFASGAIAPWTTVLSLTIYLALTLSCAFCIYRLIEQPTRDAMRIWIDQRMPPRLISEHALNPAPARAPVAEEPGWMRPAPRR